MTLTRRTALTALAGTVGLPLGALALTSCNPAADQRSGGTSQLRFSWWGNADRLAATEEMVALFQEGTDEVTVSTEPGDITSYWDRLNTAVAAGDEPDVITMGGAYPAEYAARGLLLDLGSFPEILDLSVFDQAALDPGTVDGTVVGVPTGTNAPAMIVNRAVLEAAGFELPDTASWTWDDYVEVSRAVTEASEQGTYGSGTILTHDSLDLWARQQGRNLYTEDGALGLDAAVVEGFFDLSLRLVESAASPGAEQLVELTDAGAEQSLMGTGRAAFMATWSSSLTALSEAAGTELELVPLPGEAPRPGAWLQPSQMYTVSARTAVPEQAVALVAFLLTDPEAARIVLTDRGVPAVASQREVILEDLSATARAEVDYIEQLSGMDLAPTWIGPDGSTAIEEITPRYQQEVLFGRQTPADAAAGWIEEATAAISGG